MPAYKNTSELNEVMEKLWGQIKDDPGMSSKLLASKLVVRFHYRDPEARLTVDCSDGQTMLVSTGDTANKPIVEMFMKADVAHEFWLGKVNVPVAILSGKIVSKGPTPKALALLPVIKPAYPMYPLIYEAAKKEVAS
jgi:SCP-2 sterol transfer family